MFKQDLWFFLEGSPPLPSPPHEYTHTRYIRSFTPVYGIHDSKNNVHTVKHHKYVDTIWKKEMNGRCKPHITLPSCILFFMVNLYSPLQRRNLIEALFPACKYAHM